MKGVRILTTSQVRSLEASWISNCHDEWGLVLMEQAGLGATRAFLDIFEGLPALITVLCGRGNNGGDGLVLARHLLRSGAVVQVFMVAAPGLPDKFFSRENVINRRILEKLGVEINYIVEDDLDPVSDAMEASAIIVDALLGTGLDRPVEGLHSEIIRLINDSGRTVFSVDVPSGLNSDTGQIMGTAVQASATVTFGGLKPGLLVYPGVGLAGEIRAVDIGLPAPEDLSDDLRDNLPQLQKQKLWLSIAGGVVEELPERAADSHKGTFGQVLLVSGSAGMSGASMLAAKSSLRTGAGLAVLATPKSLVKHLPPEEIIYKGVDETQEETIARSALEQILREMERAQVMVIGPGLSSNEETVSLVHDLVKHVRIPCVIDADGLNALAQDTDVLSMTEGGFIFTPHPKELSRLLDRPVSEVQSDRIRAAQEAAKKFSSVVVLKGARTIVAHPDGNTFIIPTGNSGMATAGAGDVLTGVIAGLLAQGVEAFNAAVAGAYIHGAAGDAAAEDFGEDGIMSGDIIDYVPIVIKALREGLFAGSQLEVMLQESDMLALRS